MKDTFVIICAIVIAVRELNEYKWQSEDAQPREETTDLAVKNKLNRSEFGLHLARSGDWILECITSLSETCPDDAPCEAEHAYHSIMKSRIKDFYQKTKRRYYGFIPKLLD